jgi:uncharacterized protein (TIGR02271 family)
MRTVVGLFDDRRDALRAHAALIQEGYSKAELDIMSTADKTDAAKLSHIRELMPEPDAAFYIEGVRRGGTIITAYVEESTAPRAAEIMSGYTKNRITGSVRTRDLTEPSKNENSLEVIEEELHVAKETVERGRTRIFSVVSEKQVQQDVHLRDETLRVQRRPVNREVLDTPDLFRERSYEMTEVDEIATVGKTAHVVEEVQLGKEIVDKVETIKGALRRQDVRVEEIPVVRPFKEYEADFRGFHTKSLASSGIAYEKFGPAFLFGYELSTHENRHRNSWTEVEADCKRTWEEKNPGTWEKNKDAIKYAWEKTRNAH